MTLERILKKLSSGFKLSEKEKVVGTILPKCEESVRTIQGHGSYISEGGAPIEAVPDSYFGQREYFTESGEYLFTESLPLQKEYVWHQGGCSCCNRYEVVGYKISEKATPAREQLQTIHTSISGKIFWVPYRISCIETIIPEEIRGSVGEICESGMKIMPESSIKKYSIGFK